MTILIAPNAFKGSLSANNAALSIASGLTRSGIEAKIKILPIADGGDGTLAVLLHSMDLTLMKVDTVDPLGRAIQSNYGINHSNRIAVIELAEASGIRLLKKTELNPWQANTFGTGILIKHAIANGAKKIQLTVGGSASVDGAVGILEALGVLFLDRKDQVIPSMCPSKIKRIERIDLSAMHALCSQVSFEILCDVTNPLLGERGAARVFAPQKGANASDVIELEVALSYFSQLVKASTGKNIEAIRHGGAAGGVAAVLYGLLDAELKEGAQAVLEQVGFYNQLHESDIVITGEGQLDDQTLDGKAPGIAAIEAKKAGKRVIGFFGESNLNDTNHPFDEIIEINYPEDRLDKNKINTARNLQQAAYEYGMILKGL
jgi:glycerate 2-kinase